MKYRLVTARLLQTYHLAKGVVNTAQNHGSLSSHIPDIGIILGSKDIKQTISGWALPRQSAVLAILNTLIRIQLVVFN